MMILVILQKLPQVDMSSFSMCSLSSTTLMMHDARPLVLLLMMAVLRLSQVVLKMALQKVPMCC